MEIGEALPGLGGYISYIGAGDEMLASNDLVFMPTLHTPDMVTIAQIVVGVFYY